MKRLLVTLLLLAVTLSAVLGWLLTTENGLRWIYRQAESTMAGALQVQQVSGNLSDGVTLQGLDFKDANVQLRADQVLLQWNPWALLLARLDITAVAIQQLDIELLQLHDDGNSPSSTINAPPLGLPRLNMPLPVQLRELSIARFSLTQGNTHFALEKLRLKTAAQKSQISISELDVRLIDVVIDASHRYDFDIHLAADIDTAADYEHELHIEWKTRLASGAMIDNTTRITGNLDATQLIQQTQGPLQLNLSLELSDLLERLNWQASLDVVSFDTSLLATELPKANGSLELQATGDLSSARVNGRLDADSDDFGKLDVNFAVELSDLLERLSWQASLDVVNFDTSLLAVELPKMNGNLKLQATGDLSSAQVNGQLRADSDDFGKLDANFALRSLDQARLTDGLQIDSLELDMYDGKLAAQGQLYWSPMLSWSSSVTASDINPAQLLADWPGKLATRLHTEGQIEDGKITASARIDELSGTLRDYPVSLQGNLHWRDDTLEVETAHLTSANTQISARGKIGKTLDLDWSLDSRNLGELYPEAQGQLKANGHLAGETAAPTIAARFNGNSIRFIDYSVENIDGDINIDPLNWQQLDVRFTASELDIQGQHLQSLKVNANQKQIQASIDADIVKAIIKLAGGLDDQGWSGKLMTADVNSRDFSTWALKAPVALSFATDSISSDPLCLKSEQQAEICSSFHKRAEAFDIRFDLTRVPLQMMRRFIPPELQVSGVINAGGDLKYDADGRLLGKLDAEFPAATISYPLQTGKPERFDYRLGELSITLEPAQITATTRLELENGDHLEGSLTMPNADILQLDIERQPIQARLSSQVRDWIVLDAMIPQIEALGGELELDITVGGNLSQPLLQGSARLENGGFQLKEPPLKVEQIVVDLQSKDAEHMQYKIDAVVASGKIALRGDTLLDKNAGWASNLSLDGAGFDLAILLAPWIQEPLEISGEMNATAELKFQTPDRLFGEMRLSSEHGNLLYPLVDEEADRWSYRDAFVDLTLDEAGISATAGIVTRDDNRSTAQLTLPAARLLTLDPENQALEAAAQVHFRELDLIHYLVPEIDKMKGELTLDISAAGSMIQPKVIVNAEIQQASFNIPRIGLKIDQVSLQGSSDAQQRFNFKISAHSGEGQLLIEGSSQLDAQRGWPSTINITGKDFEVSRIPEAQVTVSPDLKITIDAPSIKIEGDLLLPYAKLQPRDITTADRVSRDTVIIGGEQQKEKPWLISTNVNLTLGERVTFFGFGFESELGGRLLIEDAPNQQSRGIGEIMIRNGRYRAYGQRLDIEKGRLLFTGGALDNPGLDLRAQRTVNDVTVGLQVLGRLQQPEVELFSIPAMGQVDMLSYLLFGRPMEDSSEEDNEAMGQAALALGLAGGDSLARSLGYQLGFDEMRVEGNDTGDDASLVVGRYLSPELYVSYGVGLVESLNSINLRYQLSRRWQLEAESGEFQGADLFYTIER